MARDICEWLDDLGLSKYANVFAENEIDFEALRYLTEEDLREIGIALGARRKLLAAISELGQAAAACRSRRPARSSVASASPGRLAASSTTTVPTLSQQRARLRADSLVTTRRDGKAIYYSLASEKARETMELVYKHFCKD